MAEASGTGERFGGELKRFGVEQAGTPFKVVKSLKQSSKA